MQFASLKSRLCWRRNVCTFIVLILLLVLWLRNRSTMKTPPKADIRHGVYEQTHHQSAHGINSLVTTGLTNEERDDLDLCVDMPTRTQLYLINRSDSRYTVGLTAADNIEQIKDHLAAFNSQCYYGILYRTGLFPFKVLTQCDINRRMPSTVSNVTFIMFYEVGHYFMFSVEKGKRVKTMSPQAWNIENNDANCRLALPSHNFDSHWDCSDFVTCNIAQSKTYVMNNITSVGSYNHRNRAFMETMQHLSQILQFKFNYSVWIQDGTLLSWYRECGISRFENDIDFGGMYTDQVEEMEQRFKGDWKTPLYYSFGWKGKSREISLLDKVNPFKIDIFFHEKLNHSHTRYSLHMGHRVKYRVLPEFKKCSADLLGVRIVVPCNPAQILQMTYGSMFMTPISDRTKFNYVNIDDNMTFQWPEADLKHKCRQYNSDGLFVGYCQM